VPAFTVPQPEDGLEVLEKVAKEVQVKRQTPLCSLYPYLDLIRHPHSMLLLLYLVSQISNLV
jgi:hypothetical protein